MNRIKDQLGAFLSLAVIFFSRIDAQTTNKIQEVIRRRFPGVRQLPTQRLADWLGATITDPRATERLALIDARSPAEFAVSHLPGAHNCRSIAEVARVVPDKSRGRIVVYCSMGYRSSSFATKLQGAGFMEVYNLEGSIFAWANEGRSVVQGAAVLNPPKVHPYNRKWGQLLKPEFRAPLR